MTEEREKAIHCVWKEPTTVPPPVVRWKHDPIGELIEVLVKMGDKAIVIEMLEESLFDTGTLSPPVHVFIRGNATLEGTVQSEIITHAEDNKRMRKLLKEIKGYLGGLIPQTYTTENYVAEINKELARYDDLSEGD